MQVRQICGVLINVKYIDLFLMCNTRKTEMVYWLRISRLNYIPGGYSGFQVKGMIEGLFWV